MHNSSYEHPDVSEMIKRFKSISMSISVNQLMIKHHLIKYKMIFLNYKKNLERLEEFGDIFELIQKEDIFISNFQSLNKGLLAIESFQETNKKIIDYNIINTQEIEESILNSKDFLSKKIKLEDDLELN
tara:strand:- start:195 stop:581 length:387 start_codon:yes stop_codon:yes gene_type:complete